MSAEKKKNSKSGEGEMSFLEHLEELRWHIIRSIGAVLVLMIAAFVFKNIIFDHVILAPKSPGFFTNRILCQFGELVNTKLLCINTRHLELINIKMSGQLTTHIAVSMIAGLILAFPVILWEFWKFFKPALHNNEAQHARGAVFIASMLFFVGVLFGYFMLTPLSIHFLGSYQVSAEVTNTINVRSYIGTISSICLATGIIFELPIIVFFLTKVGIVTPGFLRKYRKHSIVVIVILSAIITPPDIFSQLLVSIPLFVLYEIGINISKRVMKKQEKEREQFMRGESSDKTQ
ncbi:MAG TPA: twin-arginine translocase subunit TatC [Bacteroidales bacterium]|nr:twin-arginine translocase subunit TatC [Bacteroidales bacterium]